jgi:hypothetical protein
MICPQPVHGVVCEQVGDGWMAYSPMSGHTQWLNDTSAAVLDLVTSGCTTAQAVYEAIAQDTDMPTEVVSQIVSPHWNELAAAGLLTLARKSA